MSWPHTSTQEEGMSPSVPLLAELDHLWQQEVEAYEPLLALHQAVQGCLAAPALNPLLTSLQAREHVVRPGPPARGPLRPRTLVGGVKALGEPAINWPQQVGGLSALALALPQAT